LRALAPPDHAASSSPIKCLADVAGENAVVAMRLRDDELGVETFDQE
jgi:hypothetical protein